MSIVLVTGTGTGVGKTIATAAVAAAAIAAGRDVAVCKPVQTGSADGDDDLGEVARLSGVIALQGGWRYPEALAPVAAARRAELALPSRGELVATIRAADGEGRLTLVEGAGGLLVEIGAEGVTMRDLAVDLDAPVLLVVGAALGTLNHTALTLEALAARHVPCSGLIVGAWQSEPGVAEADNRIELDRLAPVRAALPAGAGALTAEAFSAMSTAAFEPAWIRNL